MIGRGIISKARLLVILIAMETHAGPWFYDSGTLCQADRDAIFDATGVSAGIRPRKQWGGRRGLTLSGPPRGMEEAKRMADAFINESAGQRPSGPSDSATTRVTEARREKSKRTKEMVEASGNWSQEPWSARKASKQTDEAEARPAEWHVRWEEHV